MLHGQKRWGCSLGEHEGAPWEKEVSALSGRLACSLGGGEGAPWEKVRVLPGRR